MWFKRKVPLIFAVLRLKYATNIYGNIFIISLPSRLSPHFLLPTSYHFISSIIEHYTASNQTKQQRCPTIEQSQCSPQTATCSKWNTPWKPSVEGVPPSVFGGRIALCWLLRGGRLRSESFSVWFLLLLSWICNLLLLYCLLLKAGWTF